MKKFFYRVTKLDTVLSISTKFKIPPSKIIKDNLLEEEISEGDLLYLEELDGNIITVSPKDSLLSLSKKFNITEEEILRKNNIDYIFIGQILII